MGTKKGTRYPTRSLEAVWALSSFDELFPEKGRKLTNPRSPRRSVFLLSSRRRLVFGGVPVWLPSLFQLFSFTLQKQKSALRRFLCPFCAQHVHTNSQPFLPREPELFRLRVTPVLTVYLFFSFASRFLFVLRSLLSFFFSLF